MKKIETHIYIALAVFVALFIVGSFYDYELSNMLYSKQNMFGLVTSVIEPTFGYGVVAFIGGGFFALFFKKQYKTIFRVLFIAAALGCLGVAVFFAGREFFGPNGFYWIGVARSWGYLIAFPAELAIACLGYLLTKNSKNGNLWLLYLIMAVVIAIVLLAGTSLFKVIFHRPRFRSIFEYETQGLRFHEWYSPCKDYKYWINEVGLDKDEFKSFPSGHTSVAAVLMMSFVFLPCLDNKYKKWQIPLFYVGLVFTLLTGFVRILVGAHFLSDVSFGALLAIIFFLIARVVIVENKTLSQKILLPEEVENNE